jgi:hypothetical protein
MVRDSHLLMQGITFCEKELVDISRTKHIVNYMGPLLNVDLFRKPSMKRTRISSFSCLVSLNCNLQPAGRDIHLQFTVTV